MLADCSARSVIPYYLVYDRLTLLDSGRGVCGVVALVLSLSAKESLRPRSRCIPQSWGWSPTSLTVGRSNRPAARQPKSCVFDKNPNRCAESLETLAMLDRSQSILDLQSHSLAGWLAASRLVLDSRSHQRSVLNYTEACRKCSNVV